MEVHIEKRAVRQIRLSTADTIEEGDTEALREDILDAFPDHQVEEVEQHLGGTELTEVLTQMLEEWSGDDVDELLELLETTLGDYGVVLRLVGEEDGYDSATSDDDNDDNGGDDNGGDNDDNGGDNDDNGDDDDNGGDDNDDDDDFNGFTEMDGEDI
ncbi:MAG: hypothetical protein VB934_04000 [Polyangiaceae bacterium]